MTPKTITPLPQGVQRADIDTREGRYGFPKHVITLWLLDGKATTVNVQESESASPDGFGPVEYVHDGKTETEIAAAERFIEMARYLSRPVEYLSLADMANLTGVHRNTIRKYIGLWIPEPDKWERGGRGLLWERKPRLVEILTQIKQHHAKGGTRLTFSFHIPLNP